MPPASVEPMRAFVAIELPDSIKDRLRSLTDRLRRSHARASWVKAERIHLTLRFMGDVPEEDADRLRGLLAGRYAGLDGFELRVRGLGAFPNARKPSVVWAGVTPLEGALERGQAIAEEGARAIGLKPEKRRFRPHLTLARIRDVRQTGDLPRRLGIERDFDAGSFSVSSVSLFSSELTRSGPIYERIEEFRF